MQAMVGGTRISKLVAVLLSLMLAAATTKSTPKNLTGRVIIPFGQGWRYHIGDSPDGPSYGSGALSSFIPRAACTNMTEHIEWVPGGHKEAGQPYTPCAIACRLEFCGMLCVIF